MCLDKPSISKFKRVCAYLPNLALLTKIASPGEVQVTYGHAFIGNKSLEETVTAFALAGFLNAPTVVTIDDECNFAGTSDNIRLPTTEVLLCAAVGNLYKLEKLRNWEDMNTVLLPSLLTKAVVLEVETVEGEILKTFYNKIVEHG